MDLFEVTMLPIDSPVQQYVLSLDNLDLSFLRQYVERPAVEKRLLWSKKYLDGESVYCEVQIPSEDLGDGEAYIEFSDNYQCHICNIDVPRPYIKQHNMSRKHQNFNKLMEKVLQSVLKQIKIDVDCVDGYERHDKFYCEVCSKVVLLKHKQHHNQSKFHLKSLEEQKVVDYFLEIYVEKDEVNSTSVEVKSESVEVKTREIECDSESDTDWNFDTESENETDTDVNQGIQIITDLPKASDIDVNEGIQIITDLPKASDIDVNKGIQIITDLPKASDIDVNKGIQIITDLPKASDIDVNKGIQIITDLPKASDIDVNKGIQIITDLTKASDILNENADCSNSNSLDTSNEMNNFLLYLEEMKTKYKLDFDLPIIEDEYIVIVTPKGYKEKITIDAFHGYIKRLDATLCQICYCFNLTSEDKDRHSQTEVHVKSITQPIDDNFIRKTYLGGCSHCLLCNTMTFSSYHATGNSNHKKYNQVIHSKTFCDICEIDIHSHNFASHTRGKKHKDKWINKYLKNQVQSQTIVENKDQYYRYVKFPSGGKIGQIVGESHSDESDYDLETDSNKCDISKLTLVDNISTYTNHNIANTSKVIPCSKMSPEKVISEEKIIIKESNADLEKSPCEQKITNEKKGIAIECKVDLNKSVATYSNQKTSTEEKRLVKEWNEDLKRWIIKKAPGK